MTEKTAPKAATTKAKKAKPPAIEDKPFHEFMEQHFTPALKAALLEQGLEDIQVTFTQAPIPVAGANPNDTCWQVKGIWRNGQRHFNLYFLQENIKGPKAFSCATDGSPASTLESFMIDERKVTLDLMVLYTLQRLNGQKWLAWN